MMPGMTGLEVCRQLKQNPQTAALPVIFVTALSDSKDEAEGFAAGAVDYISKPVSPPIVLAHHICHWYGWRSWWKPGCRSSSGWAGRQSSRITKPACM
jgi:CheY-like chemotaxis protein